MQAPAPFSDPALYNDYYTYNFHVPADLRTSLKIDVKHPKRTLHRVGKDLKFTTEQRRGDFLDKEPLSFGDFCVCLSHV